MSIFQHQQETQPGEGGLFSDALQCRGGQSNRWGDIICSWLKDHEPDLKWFVYSNCNKVGIRCTFKLPWRMPWRYVFIGCCLRQQRGRDWHWPKHFSHQRHYTNSARRNSDLCNEQLINLIQALTQSVPASMGVSVMCGILTECVNRKNFNKVQRSWTEWRN